jgi:hypothetical protein
MKQTGRGGGGEEEENLKIFLFSYAFVVASLLVKLTYLQGSLSASEEMQHILWPQYRQPPPCHPSSHPCWYLVSD